MILLENLAILCLILQDPAKFLQNLDPETTMVISELGP